MANRGLTSRERSSVDPGRKALGEMFWYQRPAVTVSLNRSWTTRQVILGTTGTLVIETLRPMLYMISTDSDEPVYIGPNINLSRANGFAWRLVDSQLTFAMGENSRLYAIKHPSLEALTIHMFILEMGV